MTENLSEGENLVFGEVASAAVSSGSLEAQLLALQQILAAQHENVQAFLGHRLTFAKQIEAKLTQVVLENRSLQSQLGKDVCSACSSYKKVPVEAAPPCLADASPPLPLYDAPLLPLAVPELPDDSVALDSKEDVFDAVVPRRQGDTRLPHAETQQKAAGSACTAQMGHAMTAPSCGMLAVTTKPDGGDKVEGPLEQVQIVSTGSTHSGPKERAFGSTRSGLHKEKKSQKSSKITLTTPQMQLATASYYGSSNDLGEGHITDKTESSCVHRVFHRRDASGVPVPRTRSLISDEEIQNLKRGFGCADFCDLFVAGCIAVNGFFIGFQTEYMAQTRSEEVPEWFVAVETLFLIVFTVELACRLMKHRLRFFYMPNWGWNMFDTVLVCLQLFDIVLESYFKIEDAQSASQSAKGIKNLAFMRLLRILRLVRVLRLVRLLAFFGELNVVTAAIVGSLRSLLGTCLLLLLMVYINGVLFTQITTTHRISETDAGKDDDEELKYWWGSLGRSILTLYEAILAGTDWDQVVAPLIGINLLLGFMFVLYIAFSLLAMMNVITGIFVESALKNAERLKDESFAAHIRAFCRITDIDGDGQIRRDEFEECMLDSAVQVYMKDMCIDQTDARSLFDFLDDDGSDSIDADELVCGLVKLRATAKFTDVMTLLQELDVQKHQMVQSRTLVLAQIDALAMQIEKLVS